jgi:hypothetical protein
MLSKLKGRFSSMPHIAISSNEYIDSFETDIMIRVYLVGVNAADATNNAGQTPIRVINVEVDGPKHAFPTNRRFCVLRDKYLKDIHGFGQCTLWTAEHEQRCGGGA